ncbi:hypothetical protein QG516_20940 [Pedobacter gandavensis]|uniref:hypothetical protein n=1 Tax=Pedobacter gandavensis TaxID=2679963 RepID=UPI002478A406|nr:hypothetical protein [Pedobacter gandavensis]WGQ08982.1 hypothetical protein QG516_20940 [Pedobacter gandavensis]
MRAFFIIALLIAGYWHCYAQKNIRDKHITNQQERMVFKQWSKNKFTPTSGFLGLNPEYLLTWAWHPNYPKKDLRPLSAAGPQSQRLLLVAAMNSTENAYKLQADTLRNTVLSEAVSYSGDLSVSDPLWLLYYRHEFNPLLEQDDALILNGLEHKVKEYLIRTGILSWYLEESQALEQRLEGARVTTLDRGSRIIAYHRLLNEYRKLNATWENKKQRAKLYLSLTETTNRIKARDKSLAPKTGRTDSQIADDILSKSKL